MEIEKGFYSLRAIGYDQHGELSVYCSGVEYAFDVLDMRRIKKDYLQYLTDYGVVKPKITHVIREDDFTEFLGY